MAKTEDIMGAKMMGEKYRIIGATNWPTEVQDLARRRTSPFLDYAGLDTRPLTFLLQEVWMQGVKDAVDVLTENGLSSHSPTVK